MTISTAFSAPFLPALGAVTTLAVDYANLHPDSFLNNPAYTGYDALVAGDQIAYKPTVEASGNTCSLSVDGLITIDGEPVGNQTFDYALVTQVSGYTLGSTTTETIVIPLEDLILSPTSGVLGLVGLVPLAEALTYIAGFSGTLVNWETNLPYANQTGLKMVIRATFNGNSIGSPQVFSTDVEGNFTVPYVGAQEGAEYFVALANSDETITELHKLTAVV